MEIDKKKLKQLNVRVPSELVDYMKILAIRYGMTLELYIGRVLALHAQEQKKYE